MITVKYERYWNDYIRKHEEKSFSSLADLEEWIFGKMQQDYAKAMSFPTVEAAARIHNEGPWASEFRPVWGEEAFWIHQISYSHGGIIFTDGKFTSGQRHWSKEVQSWLDHCKERCSAPKFNFSE